MCGDSGQGAGWKPSWGARRGGATALVGLMVSDAWAQARQRLGRFLGRGDEDEARSADLELQRSREELVAAGQAGDDQATADVEAGWRTRLRRVLREDPAAAEELRALLDELSPRPGDGSGTVTNTISGGVQHGTVIQGRDFSGGLTFNGPGTPPSTRTGTGTPADVRPPGRPRAIALLPAAQPPLNSGRRSSYCPCLPSAVVQRASEQRASDQRAARAAVSVVVIAYDDAGHVAQAVRSALRQGPAVIEVIAVDDGSRDGTGQVLDRLAREEPRLSVLRRERNSGGCGTRATTACDASARPG
ncbi:glycosyltransferase [Streptomyces sp. M19]